MKVIWNWQVYHLSDVSQVLVSLRGTMSSAQQWQLHFWDPCLVLVVSLEIQEKNGLIMTGMIQEKCHVYTWLQRKRKMNCPLKQLSVHCPKFSNSKLLKMKIGISVWNDTEVIAMLTDLSVVPIVVSQLDNNLLPRSCIQLVISYRFWDAEHEKNNENAKLAIACWEICNREFHRYVLVKCPHLSNHLCGQRVWFLLNLEPISLSFLWSVHQNVKISYFHFRDKCCLAQWSD